jgi:hypothetical protein
MAHGSAIGPFRRAPQCLPDLGDQLGPCALPSALHRTLCSIFRIHEGHHEQRGKPFRIAVGDDVLDDLKSRDAQTRWPEAELVDDWSQGVPLKWIEEVCRYWASDYDWRRREALLNRFPQFTTTIDGLNIHFLHVRSPHAGHAADHHPRLAGLGGGVPQGH